MFFVSIYFACIYSVHIETSICIYYFICYVLFSLNVFEFETWSNLFVYSVNVETVIYLQIDLLNLCSICLFVFKVFISLTLVRSLWA